MGEKIIGFHAIEEGLKKASSGSVLYIARGMGDVVIAFSQVVVQKANSNVRSIAHEKLRESR